MSTLDSLKPVLEKMAEQDKLSPELLEKIVKIQEGEKDRLSKNIDAFIDGKIDVEQFKIIQESKSKENVKLHSDEVYKKEQEPSIEVISDKDVKKIWDKMPLLGYYKKTLPSEFKAVLPFSGKRFLVVGLHFTKDLLPFLQTCEALGLEPKSTYVFWKPYRYPHREPIIAYLEKKDYKVHDLEKMKAVMKEIGASTSDLPIIVIEDGG